MDAYEEYGQPQPVGGMPPVMNAATSHPQTDSELDRELLLSTSMLHELNMNSTEDMFALRRLIYENQDAFYGDVRYQQQDRHVSPELIAQCKDIEGSVQDGVRLLVDNLQGHTDARQAIIGIRAQQTKLDAACRQVAVAISGLRDCIFGSADVRPLLVPMVDDLLQKLAHVKESAKGDLDLACGPHRERLQATGEVLSRLASTYAFKRCADVTYGCPVCLHRPVERFMVPCGHTLCKECTQNVVEASGLCPMCRVEWVNVGNLYFQ